MLNFPLSNFTQVPTLTHNNLPVFNNFDAPSFSVRNNASQTSKLPRFRFERAHQPQPQKDSSSTSQEGSSSTVEVDQLANYFKNALGFNEKTPSAPLSSSSQRIKRSASFEKTPSNIANHSNFERVFSKEITVHSGHFSNEKGDKMAAKRIRITLGGIGAFHGHFKNTPLAKHITHIIEQIKAINTDYPILKISIQGINSPSKHSHSPLGEFYAKDTLSFILNAPINSIPINEHDESVKNFLGLTGNKFVKDFVTLRAPGINENLTANEALNEWELKLRITVADKSREFHGHKHHHRISRSIHSISS